MQRRHVLALPLLAAGTRAAAAPQVLTHVDTALGAFVIAVDPAVAPITVANYLAYVDGKHLDQGSVYRLVTLANQSADTKHKIEVVQWGMGTDDKRPRPFPPIAHETTRATGLKHRDGTVSMARNGPGTASSEFFICIGEQPELDFGGGRNPDAQGFAAFGQVVQGMDIVRALHGKAQVKQFIDKPIVVSSVRRV